MQTCTLRNLVYYLFVSLCVVTSSTTSQQLLIVWLLTATSWYAYLSNICRRTLLYLIYETVTGKLSLCRLSANVKSLCGTEHSRSVACCRIWMDELTRPAWFTVMTGVTIVYGTEPQTKPWVTCRLLVVTSADRVILSIRFCASLCVRVCVRRITATRRRRVKCSAV